MIRRVLLLLVLCAGPVAAQDRPVADTAPVLSVEEQKDRELLGLKMQLTAAFKTIAELQSAIGSCQARLGPYEFEQNGQALQQDRHALQERVETRTGYAWDPDTGKFGAKKPDPPKKPGGQ
jgi:hypothetical protein